MTLIDQIQHYLLAKNELWHGLPDAADIPPEVYPEHKALFGALLKDTMFEATVFDYVLRVDPDTALEHLQLYYLQGDPRGKPRFKGNLEVMLDDVRQILGQEALQTLVDGLSKQQATFYAIKQAIDFARHDANDD